MRKTALITGEYYHVFNRGVDKRQVFMDVFDSERFLKILSEFNTSKAVGGVRELEERLRGNSVSVPGNKLVSLVAYCLNPNHFHILLRQDGEMGISKFMHRIGVGYTMYFNKKYKRNGALFQGAFKSKHVESNEQLLYVSAYVNLNDRVHTNSGKSTVALSSSWSEYVSETPGVCETGIILGQFDAPSSYHKFAIGVAEEISQARQKNRDRISATAEIRSL